MALTKEIRLLIITVLVIVQSVLCLSSCSEEIYATGIAVTNEDIKTESDGTRHIVFYPDENGKRAFQIEYEITPKNVTETDVTYIYNTQSEFVTVSKNGLVTFDESVNRPLSVTVGVSVKTESSVLTDYIIITSWHESKS